MIPTRIASLCGILALTGPVAAQTPGFWLMGLAPGTNQGATMALSQDGSVAAGYSAQTLLPYADPGFLWTAGGGRSDFTGPGMPLQSPAYGLSSDGNTVVGYMDGPAPTRAYRRVGSGAFQDLGAGPYDRSYASGVSGDGSVVVGHGEFTQFGQDFGEAFRWTQQGGMQFLGTLHPGSRISKACAVSRDGGTVVGYSDAGAPEAFVWRQSTGIQALAVPPGWSTLFSYAYGANADGSVIVGQADAPDTSVHAIRWTPAGPQDLGGGAAVAASDDGLVVAGLNQFLWTPATGRTVFSSYLAQAGVTIPAGWTPRDIYAVSGDGMSFAGGAVSASGALQGFVATVPAPTGAVILFLPTLLLQRRRRAIR